MSDLFRKIIYMQNKEKIETAVGEIKTEWEEYLERKRNGVRYSLDVVVYNEWERKYAEYQSFSQAVLDLIEKKGLSSTVFYGKAHIDRKLFSKMKTDYCYRPNKITAIKLCFGLDLPFEDAEALLKKAGFALMRWDPFDLAITYCFEKGITDIDVVNEILLQLDLQTI